MSCSRTALACRYALMSAPPLKMGPARFAPRFQAFMLPAVSAESSGLTRPNRAVRLRCGKKSATATPTCALAERRSCSFWRMSGRRSSSADGSPAGTSAGSNSWSREWLRVIGPGFCPSRTLRWFSCATICRSRSGTVAAVEASKASAEEVSSLDTMPPCMRCVKILRLSPKELVVRWAISSSWSSASNWKYAWATWLMSEMVTSRRASWLARYCARAASLRRRRRPQRSTSHEALPENLEAVGERGVVEKERRR